MMCLICFDRKCKGRLNHWLLWHSGSMTSLKISCWILRLFNK